MYYTNLKTFSEKLPLGFSLRTWARGKKQELVERDYDTINSAPGMKVERTLCFLERLHADIIKT